MKELFTRYRQDAATLIDAVAYKDIERLVVLLLEAFEKEQLIFLAGNGGSAASASHFHEDLAYGALKGVKTEKHFRAVCLCDSSPYVTAIGNDCGYENVFLAQMQNLALPGSLFIGITCSGNSPNILRCLGYAGAHGMQSYCLLGFTGGKAAGLCKNNLLIKNEDFGLIEAIHSLVLHYVPYEINKRLKELYGEVV